jgi:hypothetical protein
MVAPQADLYRVNDIRTELSRSPVLAATVERRAIANVGNLPQVADMSALGQSRRFGLGQPLPIYLNQRTSPDQPVWSVSCHQATSE